MTDERLRTDACPCGEPFDVERHEVHRVRRRDGAQWSEDESTSWTVTCAAGHSYDVELGSNMSPRWVLHPERKEP